MVSASLRSKTKPAHSQPSPGAVDWHGLRASGRNGELGLLAPMLERQIALGHEEPLGEPVGGDEESRAPAD